MAPTGGVTTGTAGAEGSASSKSYDSTSTPTDSLKENGCHDGGEDGGNLKSKKAAGTGTSTDAGGDNGFASSRERSSAVGRRFETRENCVIDEQFILRCNAKHTARKQVPTRTK